MKSKIKLLKAYIDKNFFRLLSVDEKNYHDSIYIGEQEIFRNRFVLGTLVLILGYFFINESEIILAFSVYLSLATILWVAQITDILSSNTRLSIGILLETSMGYYLLSFDSVGFAYIYPLYLWTILGNGFRFGVTWLTIASLFSVISFSAIIITEPYWHENIGFSISLLLALVVIPAYCSKLIKGLSNAKEKAETANRAKSYFLASVSHELRTPLNAIIGYGTHLSTMGLKPSQLKMVNSSVTAGQHLLQLIEQILLLGKSDTQADNIETSDFEITRLLVEVKDMLQIRSKEKGLELILQSEANSQNIYHGPAKDIKNLLLNISSNAIKFTDCGQVIIRDSIKESEQGVILELSITDTGIGIDKDACEKIFEPFQQADQTIMERFGGTGLGLAICKQIVDKLGGEISVTSEINQGSCFKLSIPLEHAENSDNDLHYTENNYPVKILSLGHEKEDMLLQAQCSGDYFISHHNCKTISEINIFLQKNDITDFDIVILDQSIVGEIGNNDKFWQPFQSASIATVIIAEGKEFDIHKINIQAAFSAILPPTASFNKFRQAIKIGTSYSEIIAEDIAEISQENIKPIANNIVNIARILVVDDNRTNRMVLESILQSAGHDITLVNDGDEALEKLEQEQFDIMLIDVNMPKLNGIDATKLWRHMEDPNNMMPILGVTADATEETHNKCIAAGMNERITKPVEAQKLISKVEHYLKLNKKEIIENISKEKIYNANMVVLNNDRLEYLESIGDKNFIRLIIDSYIDEVNEIQGNLYENNIACNIEKFRFFAHAIKSSANNIGANNLSKICSEYENILEHAYNADPASHIDKLVKEIKKAEKDILQIRNQYIPENNTRSISK